MLENIELRLILSRKGSNSLFLTLVVNFSLLSEAWMTQKNYVELTQRALNRYKQLKHAKYKKRATFRVFWREPDLFLTQKLRFWNHFSDFSGGKHIREHSKTYPKSNFGWYGPPTHLITGTSFLHMSHNFKSYCICCIDETHQFSINTKQWKFNLTLFSNNYTIFIMDNIINDCKCIINISPQQ